MRQVIYPVPGLPVPEDPPPPLEATSLEIPQIGRLNAWGSEAAGDGTRPRLLFFHGNGENLETMRRVGLFERLGSLGVSFLAIDYPGYGRSEGSPSEEALLAAAAAALDHLRAQADESPVILCGWSLGAAVATALADQRAGQIDGVVLLSAWTSLAEVAAAHFPAWLTALALRERYDSLERAPRIEVPTLVIHGGRDSIIPVEQGRRLAEALPRGRWVEIPGAGHNDLMAVPEVWAEMTRFLEQLDAGSGRLR